MKTPLVTIIMATYNDEKTIDTALKSLLGQTYTNWHLVICDDASKDSTYTKLAAFSHQHARRVTLLHHENNQKLASALNTCLAHARGDFIARMDSDDISAPQRLERQVEFLLQHPEIDLVGSAIQRFDGEGLKDILLFSPRPDKYSLKQGVPFTHATILARAEVYRTLRGYTVSPRTRRSQDLDLWFRFYSAGFRGANLPEPLYLVREDQKAMKRRSPLVRFNAWNIRIRGYFLLGYPAHWYLYPTVDLLKALVPFSVISRYRGWQFHQHKLRAERRARE